MRTSPRFLIPLVMSAFTIDATAQVFRPWTFSHPYPTANTLNSVVTSSDGRVLLFGEGGAYLRSTDGGTSWTHAPYPAGLTRISAADLPTGTVGYITGDDVHQQGRIAKTTDGGITWTLLPYTSLGYLRSVSFVNADPGWVSGSGGMILRTTNGGAAWTAQTTGRLDDLTSIHMRSETHGLVAADAGSVLETSNGGGTWIVRSTQISGRVSKVRISAMNTSYVIGSSGQASRRSADEPSYTRIPLPINRDLFGIAHLSNGATLFCGDSGYVLRSANGTTDWTVVTTGTDRAWTDIAAIDTARLWIIGPNGRLAASSDGGRSWSMRSTGSRMTISDVLAGSGDTAFAVVQGQALLRRTSRQGPWTEHQPGTDALPRTIARFDDGVLVLGGTGGQMMRSTDGGSAWLPVPTGSTATIHGMDSHGQVGLAVGAGGSILRSTDRGAQWSPVLSGTTVTLYRVTFVSVSTVVAVGSAGSTVRSTDEGATWTPVHSGQSWTYFGVAFSDSLRGTAVGSALDAGLPPGVVRTTDGGLSWSPALMPTSEPTYPATVVMALRSVTFAPGDEGYIVGDEGACYRTTDGGTSWTRCLIGTNLSLRDVARADDGHWIVGGASGSILESTPVPTHVADATVPIETSSDAMALSAYPNPFNPSTKLRFELRESARISLSVYDLLGREVAVLESGSLIKGMHERTFAATGLASGLYFARIQGSMWSLTLPIILVR